MCQCLHEHPTPLFGAHPLSVRSIRSIRIIKWLMPEWRAREPRRQLPLGGPLTIGNTD
jgi:hypothetical protein